LVVAIDDFCLNNVHHLKQKYVQIDTKIDFFQNKMKLIRENISKLNEVKNEDEFVFLKKKCLDNLKTITDAINITEEQTKNLYDASNIISKINNLVKETSKEVKIIANSASDFFERNINLIIGSEALMIVGMGALCGSTLGPVGAIGGAIISIPAVLVISATVVGAGYVIYSCYDSFNKKLTETLSIIKESKTYINAYSNLINFLNIQNEGAKQIFTDIKCIEQDFMHLNFGEKNKINSILYDIDSNICLINKVQEKINREKDKLTTNKNSILLLENNIK